MVKMRLHVLLAERELTQKQLSLITGIRQASISAYCSNNYKHVVNSHLNKLCAYFNCSISDLIEYTKDNP